MMRLAILFLALVLAFPADAQRKTTTGSGKGTKTITKTKTGTKKKTKKGTKGTTSTTPNIQNSKIRGLQSQKADIQKKIKEQEKALKANQADVKSRLKNLFVLNSEIEDRQKSIDNIEKDIASIDGDIDMLTSQLATLKQQLQERQQKYIKSMRYMARHSSVHDKLMFVFSAHDFAQMYRRLRFVREYASYQKAQGEQVKAKQLEVENKHRQLQDAKQSLVDQILGGKHVSLTDLTREELMKLL